MSKNNLNILWLHLDAFRFDWKRIADKYNLKLKGFEFLENNFFKLNKCYTCATGTLHSTAAYLTGTYPFINGCRSNDVGTINPEIKLYPELLKEKKYKCYAILTSGPKWNSSYKRIGINKGFDSIRFIQDPTNPQEGQGTANLLMREIKNISNEINTGKNKLIYITVLDMHGWDGRDKDGKMDEYIQGMRNVDIFLRNLLNRINFEKCIVVAHGDHGWRLEGDDEIYHPCLEPKGMSLYEPLCRVGAYIKAPMLKKDEIDFNTQTIDLWPTVFGLLGIEFNNIRNGVNVLEMKKGQGVYCEHVEWNINRKSVSLEYEEIKNGTEIPLLNYAIGINNKLVVMDANKDIPVALFQFDPVDYKHNFLSKYSHNAVEIYGTFMDKFHRHFSSIIKWNEEHAIENSNEYMRENLRKRLGY